MKNLIIIDGTSAIWKGELIGYINESLPTSDYVTKLSTRAKRNTDTYTDLNFVYVAAVEHPGSRRLNSSGAENEQPRRASCTLTRE